MKKNRTRGKKKVKKERKREKGITNFSKVEKTNRITFLGK